MILTQNSFAFLALVVFLALVALFMFVVSKLDFIHFEKCRVNERLVWLILPQIFSISP